jgi:hypothetical protein
MVAEQALEAADGKSAKDEEANDMTITALVWIGYHDLATQDFRPRNERCQARK